MIDKARKEDFGDKKEVWEKVKHLHGRDRGSKPYPCGYCYYYNIGIIPMTEHKANIVTQFKDDLDELTAKRIKVFCEGNTGTNGPTNYAYCRKFAFQETDVRTHCIDEMFSYIEKDYTMFILSKIYEYPEGIPMSKITDRSTKGYHTRKKRILELESDGFIDMLPDNTLILTPRGNLLAQAIRDMYGNVMRIMNTPDLLAFKDCRDVFDAILLDPGHSADYYTRKMTNDARERFGRNLVNLESQGYISSHFDEEDWETILYNITPAGMRCHIRLQAERIEDGKKNEGD